MFIHFQHSTLNTLAIKLYFNISMCPIILPKELCKFENIGLAWFLQNLVQSFQPIFFCCIIYS